MDTKQIIEQYEKFVVPTYARTPIILVRGKGAKVWDSEGREYLDFFPGWAVSGLGHCHPRVVKAVREQSKKIIHVSNNYYNLLQGKLAQKLIEHSFEGKSFFCNSGAEANEAAIKLARKYGNLKKKFEVITMYDSFHGRTLATITATGQTKYQKGFEPLPEGFVHVPFNDLKAVEEAISDRTAAILVEPIQGEGGINVASTEYLQGLRHLCNSRGLLLIFDEVQTGMGRTGKWFAYQHYGIEPDVITLAKSTGGGLPIGVMVVKTEFADVLQPGTHASTFGGSPIVCSAALAVIEAIEKEDLLKNVEEVGQYLWQRLEDLKKSHSIIKEIRGKGFMLGVELEVECKAVVEKCLAKGLLINCTQERVLRLLPPLGIGKKDVDKVSEILDEALKS